MPSIMIRQADKKPASKLCQIRLLFCMTIRD